MIKNEPIESAEGFMQKEWTAVEIFCDEEFSEELAAALAELFSTAVELTGGGVRFYVPEGRAPDTWEPVLGRALRSFEEERRMERNTIIYSFSKVPDEDWAAKWKRGFKPFRIGKSIVICPSWERSVLRRGELVIWLDPGMAFGTGHHETTRMCLEWLEAWAQKQLHLECFSLLDVGTGSGILAIAAVLLGFGRVVGCDTDPEAIEVAKKNLKLNNCDGRVRLEEGTADGKETFDVVVANIQALPLMNMAGVLATSLQKDGRLVLSGILESQRYAVQAAYEKNGLNVIQAETAGEWTLLILEKLKGCII